MANALLHLRKTECDGCNGAADVIVSLEEQYENAQDMATALSCDVTRLSEQLQAYEKALREIAASRREGDPNDFTDAHVQAAVNDVVGIALATLKASFPAFSPESPCSICGTYGHFTHNHERETSSPAKERP